MSFIRSNINAFAWQNSNMIGVDLEVAIHHLSIKLSSRPVRHKIRRFHPQQQQQIIREKATWILEVGSIWEIQYPEWLAYIVVVQKKNGKWKVCVDYFDLNEVCPKDCFPLPWIDQIVYATMGHKLLSFMDTYSRYNQIPMYSPDSEKTTFIIGDDIYYFNVIPFSLKNTRATYQCMVTRILRSLLGKTMEVYVNDMLVKSSIRSKYLAHLHESFKLL